MVRSAPPNMSLLREPPQEDDANGKTWYARGQNFIIAYTDGEGRRASPQGQVDEYVVLLPDEPTKVDITAGRHGAIGGYTVTFVPPGNSSMRERRPPRAHVYDALGGPRGEVQERGSYKTAKPNIPPFGPGRSRRTASSSASTASMCRRSRAASAASGAARPSW